MLGSSFAFSQGAVDQISEPTAFAAQTQDLPTEIVRKISPSKRILILSNATNSIGKGDFITLILNNEKAVRALVAKTVNDATGIKILKIYNQNVYSLIKNGTKVKIIRGDDSFFKVKAPENELSIKDEDDLYNDKILSDDLEVDENKKRAIKTDNIIGVSLAKVPVVDNNGDTAYDNQPTVQWAYQFHDNFWAEVTYGTHVVEDFPSTGLGTRISNFVFRMKYTIEAPLDSFIMPYLGYQYLNASSPGAGQEDPNLNQDAEFYQNELDKVEDSKRSGPIFGVTLLKRFVPGWFFRADIGTDQLSLGLSLEF